MQDLALDHLAQLSTDNARAWVTANIVPLLLIGIGCVAIAAAAKSDIAKILTVIFGVVLALVVVGIGMTPGASETIAKFGASLLGVGD